MANNMRASQPMPLFVIDTCPSNDNEEPIKITKPSTSTISRWWSLPNCNETYKDLCGAIHYSFVNRLSNALKYSHSYPNNNPSAYLKSNEKSFLNQPPSTSVHFNINRLDPYGGTQTPGGSSSRYSLYGSFFDLSESGYYPSTDQSSLIKSDNKLLTIDGRPLLILDHSPRLTTDTYQHKCTDWLRQLNTNSA